MPAEYPIDKIVRRIRTIKRASLELQKLSGGVQAIDRNVERILACVKMLEVNVSDVAGIIAKD
ncbi:MAG: hypothetical protein HY667_05010 [Chloroflexi bacterium]|nr:hypothetical protein [Chloroflexota bacterium]